MQILFSELKKQVESKSLKKFILVLMEVNLFYPDDLQHRIRKSFDINGNMCQNFWLTHLIWLFCEWIVCEGNSHPHEVSYAYFFKKKHKTRIEVQKIWYLFCTIIIANTYTMSSTVVSKYTIN